MRNFLKATGILSLTASLLLVNSQPSQADLVCFPWEASCTPNGTPFTPSYFTIYAHNKTNKTIWVAANFLHRTRGVNTDTVWAIAGYWKLAPGEKALILNEDSRIEGRNIYFHAHDESGRVWGNGYNFNVCTSNGDCTSREFFEADMGSKFGVFTQGFR
jgi:hypothetical protein